MKPCVVASAFLLAALSPSWSRAQSRVSVEVGGMVSAYDVASGPGVARGAVRVPDPPPSTATVASASTTSSVSGGPSTPTQAIAAFEVRPTITLEGGFLMAVGFRAGQAGLGDNGASLVGGDLALGYQHRFGHFLPFIKGVFGFNSYDFKGSSSGHQTDLRVDAVLGTRLYVSQRIFLAAAAFAGWGDRYGGTLSIGGDVVQVFRRGVMP
jgi:hypothetical protein